MKKSKQLIALVLTVAMIFSLCIVPAFADVTTDGIQIGNKYYTLGYILGNEVAFSDIFGPADPSDVIIRMNDKAASYAAYLAAGSVDFDAFAEENPATPNPSVIVNPDGRETPVEEPGEELKVVEISAITKTTVTVKLAAVPTKEVTLADFNITGATATAVEQGGTADVYVITINSLDGKKGTVTVNGKSLAYNFEAPVAGKTKVESVTFDNYRQITVTFNGLVDVGTALNLGNYYFEIVEGKAGEKLGAVTLVDNLTLAEVNTLANNENSEAKVEISAKEVNGKHVITINLPANARIVNNGETARLEIKLADGNKKGLVKNTVTAFSVRNVKDANKELTIDTSLTELLLVDNAAPKLEKVEKSVLTSATTVKREVVNTANTIEVEKDELTKDLAVVFNEPILATDSQIELWVDGVKKPNPVTRNLVKFAEDSPLTLVPTYAEAKEAIIDLKAALGTTEWDVNGTVHNFKLIGVRDLAGNIQTPSTIEFNVKVVNPADFETTTIKPVVKEVVQIADNMLRVEWNRPGATGKLTVVTTDNALKEVDAVQIPLSVAVDHDGDPTTPVKFYSYVDIPATDKAPVAAAAAGEKGTLGFSGQNFIERKVTITDLVAFSTTQIAAKADNTAPEATNTAANNFEKTMRLYKDIHAPVLSGKTGVTGDPEDWTTSMKKSIYVDFEDVIPTQFATDIHLTNPIVGMKYKDGTVDMGSGTIKDIKVSYEKDGAVRTVDVPATAITVTSAGRITIDLTGIADLTDKDGYLVEGVTYTVEIPTGYVADPAKDDNTLVPDGESFVATILPKAGSTSGYDLRTAIAATDYDVQYVAENRTADPNGYGFTSLATVATVKVPVKADGGTTAEGVPQTSKQLIKPIKNVAGQFIEVEFTGVPTVESLKNPMNYTLNGTRMDVLGVTSADIAYRVDGADIATAKKFATIKVPVGTIPASGDVAFRVENVVNDKDAKMTPVETTVYLEDNRAPKAIDVKLEGSANILVTFDEAVTVKEGTNGKLVGVTDWESTQLIGNFTATINGKTTDITKVTFIDGLGKRTVKFTLGTNVKSGDKVVITVKADENGDVLVNDLVENPLVIGSEYTITIE